MTDTPSTSGTGDRPTELGLLIVNASRFSTAAARRKGRERSPIVIRTLSNLIRSGPLRIGDLAALEHITQPTMTGVIQRLEHEGLVDRHQHPEDGRVSLMEITASGRAVIEEFRHQAEERLQPLLDGMSAEQRAALAQASELMAEMAAHLDTTH